MLNILVTGGTGYIGSHTCLQLIAAGMTPILLDNLVNSKESVLERIHTLSGQRPLHYQGDVRDADLLDRVFADQPIDAVIHFAGLKAVGESVEKPLEYYDNNVSGTLVLLQSMRRAGVKTYYSAHLPLFMVSQRPCPSPRNRQPLAPPTLMVRAS